MTASIRRRLLGLAALALPGLCLAPLPGLAQGAPPPLKLGALASMTGGGATIGIALATAVKMAAAEINANRCTVMRFDAARGSLDVHARASAHAKAGPRHLAFGPGGRYLYTSNEEDSTLSAWRWDARRGELAEIQHLSTLPAGFGPGNHPADIQVHPGGRLVYVTNRTTGTLAGYRIDPRTGLLSRIADAPIGSPASWGFLFDPTGRWALVTAQIGDYVAIYSVDARSGELKPTGQRLGVTLPTCLRRSA